MFLMMFVSSGQCIVFLSDWIIEVCTTTVGLTVDLAVCVSRMNGYEWYIFKDNG